MKVKLIEPRATATGAQNRGDEVEVSAKEGARMIAAGQAIAVRGGQKKQTAAKKPTKEKAAK